jgi:hypothetical protein
MSAVASRTSTRSHTAPMVLPAMAATLFASAFLLFSVQPMFTKMILPVLGGSPSVWSVAMVFFQSVLLAGYLYAHLLARHCSTRQGALIHLGLMAGATVLLPIAVAGGWGRPPANMESFWLIGLFGASVGLPFFAVAANGPLLQAWFARSGHPTAHDPYYLFAASNLGSFAALLAYPVLVEPIWPLTAQSVAWKAGFVVLGGLIALCAALVGTSRADTSATAAARARPDDGPVTGRRRLAWIGLAAVPSGLLVSVTAQLSTDVAAVPLLWVIPLALFLLTFVVAFRNGAAIHEGWLVRAQVWGTALVLLGLTLRWPLPVIPALHLGLFLVNALLCHQTLYRLRPGPSRLTEFYLFLSLGGVLGGVACTLVAPAVFSRVLEYPLLLVVALACRPGLLKELPSLRGASPALTLALAAAGAAAVAWLLSLSPIMVWLIAGKALAIAAIVLWRRGAVVLTAASALALVVLNPPAVYDGVGARFHRSFFGVHKTADVNEGQFRILMHGTTIHGAMRLRNEDGSPAEGRPDLLSYFTREGGYGQALAALRAARGGSLPSVAVAGLGAGVIACHALPGERWSFFEIDPVVVDLARDPATFRFLTECAPDARIPLGDARLTLAEEAAGKSLIILDAFSSDAIPAHLLTREAIGLYLSKLDATGAIAFHISNRYLDLGHILARAGAEHGLATYLIEEEPTGEPLSRRLRAPIKLAVMARDPAHLGPIASDPRWVKVQPDLARKPWTDDYTNIMEAIWDKRRSGP